MKIKHYPGKAVDASLSLDGSSAMGALYEANWLRAAAQSPSPQPPSLRISPAKLLSRQSSSAGSSFLLDGISALSKYQMTLENIRNLEQQSRNNNIMSTIKELNGYRPSPVKMDQHQDWVTEDPEPIEDHYQEKIPETDPPKEAYSAKDKPAVNHYVLDPTERPRPIPRPRQQLSVKPPSLRRSQTMSQPPSYATLRAPLRQTNKQPTASNSSSAYSTFSSAAEEPQDQVVICQQPQRVMVPPPREPPPEPPRRPGKPLSRSQTTVQRYATIRMPNQSLYRSHGQKDSTGRRHSLEQAVKGLRLQEEEPREQDNDIPAPKQRQISPAASSNGSSKDLNGEGFCIPRPRLIVPVHTYARRRRTGNLKDQSSGAQEEEEEEAEKGKDKDQSGVASRIIG